MKIDKKALEDISKWFKSSSLSSATIEFSAKGDFKVTMSKEPSKKDTDPSQYLIAPTVVPHAVPPSVPDSMVGEATKTAFIEEEKKGTAEVVSPIVGTFYRSAGPDTPPFVQEGDTVKKGQVICILEAMKVMNEFEAEYDMEIISVLVENSQLVEYGQALFEVKLI